MIPVGDVGLVLELWSVRPCDGGHEQVAVLLLLLRAAGAGGDCHKLCHPAAGGASDVKGAVHNLGPGIEARGGGYDGEKDDDGEQDEG